MTGNSANLWDEVNINLPVIAFALHGGNEVRSEVADKLVIGQTDRRREEDPYTGYLSTVASTWLNVRRSRFEVDLNRERDAAVYPKEVWGLRVWDKNPPKQLVAESLQEYDAFYERAIELLDSMSKRFDRFIVLDLHSYNHRRLGPYAPFDPSEGNPEINVGTGNIDREYWGPVVDSFISSIGEFDHEGRHLDVRENVRFQGGHFSKWVQSNYGHVACALAVEVKKIFMNEWTDEVNYRTLESVRDALKAAVLESSLQLKRSS